VSVARSRDATETRRSAELEIRRFGQIDDRDARDRATTRDSTRLAAL
jgi:hypothetical protein